jgi:hypothetical protein
MFLKWYINIVGDNVYIIENHFHYRRISIIQPLCWYHLVHLYGLLIIGFLRCSIGC